MVVDDFAAAVFEDDAAGKLVNISICQKRLGEVEHFKVRQNDLR